MNASHWNGDENRELSGGVQRTPEQTFHKTWRYVRTTGPKEIADFLEYYSQFNMFRHLVDDCREELAAE